MRTDPIHCDKSYWASKVDMLMRSLIKDELEPHMRDFSPSAVNGLYFERLSFGLVPMSIMGVRIVPQTYSGQNVAIGKAIQRPLTGLKAHQGRFMWKGTLSTFYSEHLSYACVQHGRLHHASCRHTAVSMWPLVSPYKARIELAGYSDIR